MTLEELNRMRLPESNRVNPGMMKEIAHQSIDFSNFCQKFKMEWWKLSVLEVQHVREEDLDKLASIAFNILKKENDKRKINI